MRHFYILLIAVFIAPLMSSAQSNYKPGYVVTLKGDTIKGFINYKEWDRNPESISFKTDINSPVKKQYTIENSSAFGVNGFEYYTRHILWVSQDKIDNGELTQGLDTTRKLDTVFLRMVTTGKNVSLYAYKDQIKQRLYFNEANNNDVVELIYHEYLDSLHESKGVVINTYRIQLQRLVAEYKPGDQELINNIQTSEYLSESIEKIISRINGQQGLKQWGAKRNVAQLFIGASVSGISSKVTGSAEIGNANPTNSISPGLHVGTFIYLNKSVGKWILMADLSVMPVKTEFKYTYNSGAVTQYTQDLKFNQTVVSLTPQLLYNAYNANNFKAYISAGIGICDRIYSSKQYTLTTVYTVSGTTATGDAPPTTFESLTFNIPLNVGVIINKKINIYAGYTPRTSLTNEPQYQINEASYHAGINYLLGN